MPSIEVNGQVVEARDGEMLLETLRRAGIHIPTLCHVPELFPSGACRLCSVEVEGQPRLVPSCAFPAQEGLVVRTHSARAVDARRAIVELLLASHQDTYDLGRAGECLVCDEQFPETAGSVTNCLHHNRTANSGWYGRSVERIEQGDIAK